MLLRFGSVFSFESVLSSTLGVYDGLALVLCGAESSSSSGVVLGILVVD